jgi:hypothetical protein
MTNIRTTFDRLLISAPLVVLFAVTSPVANAQTRLVYATGEGLKFEPAYEFYAKRVGVRIGKLPTKGVIAFAAGTGVGTVATTWWCNHTGLWGLCSKQN